MHNSEAPTLMGNEAPRSVDRREDDHGEELEESEDIGFGPHIDGSVQCNQNRMYWRSRWRVLFTALTAAWTIYAPNPLPASMPSRSYMS